MIILRVNSIITFKNSLLLNVKKVQTQLNKVRRDYHTCFANLFKLEIFKPDKH